MTKMLSFLKTSGRAAIVALALGVPAYVVATPAVAQPSFNFQFGVGPDGKPSVGFGVDSDGYRVRPQVCLTDRQIIRGIRDEGYRDVQIVEDLPRNRVGVIARDGRTWYSMRVNRCTGEVDRIQRLRNFRPGLSFEFRF